MIEMKASNVDIRVVLMQPGHPIAFNSNADIIKTTASPFRP